jgi:UDP-glucose/GDP-mannose dehydrogenase family, UDP binding domain
VAVLGLSFKPNTDDMRDAPSIPLITALRDLGAVVRGYDPAAMEAAKAHLPDVIYCGSAYEAAEGAEAVVIATEWEQFRALDLDRLRAVIGAAGDRRPAQHLPGRGDEARQFPLSRRRPAERRTARGKPTAAPAQSEREVDGPPAARVGALERDGSILIRIVLRRTPATGPGLQPAV